MQREEQGREQQAEPAGGGEQLDSPAWLGLGFALGFGLGFGLGLGLGSRGAPLSPPLLPPPWAWLAGGAR